MGTDFKRQLIISSLLIFGGAIAAAVGIYFLAGNVGVLVDKIVSEKAMIDQRTGTLAVFAELKKQAQQAEPYQAAMDELLPTQDGLIGFSQWISQIASTHQVAANVSFQDGAGATSPDVSNAAGLNQTGFSISVSGNLNDIVSFLQDIESKSPGFLLEMTSFNLADTNGSYQFTGQGIVFSRQ